MFGEFIRQKRLDKGLSLREFCRSVGEDASNWSKVERGKLAPPQDEKKLLKISEILGIEKDTDEWEKLNDLSAVGAGKIPEYLLSDKEVLKALPVFFRTLGSIKPTPEELFQLMEKIRRGE